MKKSIYLKSTAIIAAAALMLTACSNTSTTKTETTKPTETTQDAKSTEDNTAETKDTTAAESETPSTVEITDVHGTVTVPVNPKNVISLDNRTFETLSDWGIQLVAVPKGVMPADSPYVADESVQDIGNHREPNLEILAAAEPELVIIGQRFASFYDEIKELVPNAAVIDLNFDVSENVDTPG